jgi:hypothetical protein
MQCELSQLDLRAVRDAHYKHHKSPQQGALSEDYTDEERLIIAAVDRYKLVNNRLFPGITEVLAVIRAVDRHIAQAGVKILAKRQPAAPSRAQRAIARGVAIGGR